MHEGTFINNKMITIRLSLNSIFFKFFGLSFFFKKIVASRCELLNSIEIGNYLLSQWFTLLNVLYKTIPNTTYLKKKWYVNICFFDIMLMYKGWRHFKGLPIRGQRTWSNCNSSYRSNLILRQLKLNNSKKIYGNISLNLLNTCNLAEQINNLWKSQWTNEWRDAKKKRIIFLQKNKSALKVDLHSMSKNIVWGFSKSNAKKNQQKKTTKNNVFTLGFDAGFSKALIKNFSKNENSNLILGPSTTLKKKKK